jgi:hypothetical protein
MAMRHGYGFMRREHDRTEYIISVDIDMTS